MASRLCKYCHKLVSDKVEFCPLCGKFIGKRENDEDVIDPEQSAAFSTYGRVRGVVDEIYDK